MKEYIEREALEYALHHEILFNENIKLSEFDECLWLSRMSDFVEKLPTADVVEVVRCEKCTHKVDFRGRVMCNRNAHRVCDEWYGLTATDNDHFCSYGIRKEDNND